jgi:MFS family permease
VTALGKERGKVLRVEAVSVLIVLSVAEFLTMSVWFAPVAVSSALGQHWQLSTAGEAWLTMAVQCGFVLGTLAVAVFNIADLLSATRLFASSALLAAAVNVAPVGWSLSVNGLLLSRFLTGAFMAGVYPPALKIVASWFRERRGLALGFLIGALTIGSACPHLLRGLFGSDWRFVLVTASCLACCGSLLTLLYVRSGPFDFPRSGFRWRRTVDVLSRPGVGLATLGYLGHMWELYAMWAWAPAYLSYALPGAGFDISLLSFTVIAVGAIGCVGAGFLADRVGRTTVAIGAMLTSGACALFAGLAVQVSPILFLAVCLLWGISIVADSAQFSACVTELSAPDEVGTALTLQNCLGFLLTMLSIRLVAALEQNAGWTFAFVVLAVGPLLGSLAMWRLRQSLATRAALAKGRG